MYFRGFMKMDNFARIKFHVLSITGSMGYYKRNGHSNVSLIHVSLIFKKRELRDNIYSAKISTFTV